MENKRKHLEFIQLVITRMNVNSFLLRGWAVTLVAALFAFAAKDANKNYVLITYITNITFWVLDAYYLSQERQYRDLYDSIRQVDEANIDYNMNATSYNKGKNTWLSCMFSKTYLLFYLTLMGTTLIIMFFIK